MRPVCNENCIMVPKQLVLITRVAFILSGLFSRALLYNTWVICLFKGGSVVEWLTRQNSNLRIASLMGSNPFRDKQLLP